MNLSPFTKDFRGGDLLRVICIFGDSAQSRATLEFQKQSEFDCLPARSGRKCSWSIVSTFSLCGPCVTPSYLFNQRGKTELFICDGIQTLDMISLGLGPNKDRFSS